MTLSRRKTLALIGGGVILAATAGIGYTSPARCKRRLRPGNGRVSTTTRGCARSAGRSSRPIRTTCSRGRSTFRSPTGDPLRRPDRLLPHTDPFNRQIVIGLGCFLEVLRMAALQDGLAVEVELFPEGEDPAGLDGRPVAICRFVPTEAPDPLFASCRRRP
jgi:hypothetical protein